MNKKPRVQLSFLVPGSMGNLSISRNETELGGTQTLQLPDGKVIVVVVSAVDTMELNDQEILQAITRASMKHTPKSSMGIG